MRRLFPLLLFCLPLLAMSQGIVWRGYKNFAISQGKEPRELVIQTQGAFDTYWRGLTGEDAAPRDVDFSKELLIAVQLGSRPSMGYKVIIRSVERTKPNEITVTYEEKKPDPNAVAAAVMTAPYEIVRVERKNAAGNFVFKKREGTPTSGSGGPVGLHWRTYQTDIVGGGPSEQARAMFSQEAWAAYWSQMRFQGPTPSDIDWNNEMVVALHLGSRPTDGYDVVMDGLEAVQGGFLVTYIEKAPSQGQRTRRTTTSPYVIVRLPKLSGPIQFRKQVWRSDGE